MAQLCNTNKFNAPYRFVVEVESLPNSEEDNGWTVLATTISTDACLDAEVLQAYQEQHPTVEPGFPGSL
jgi:hypothetical protein